MKLLLVDDDERLIAALRDEPRWRELGVDTVLTAYGVEEAMARVRAHAPELIISDIEMPMSNGIQLLKWIREQSYNCEFIFLTNYEKFEFARSALEYRASEYITKPATWDKIEVAVLRTIDRFRREVEYEPLEGRLVRRHPFSKERAYRELLFGEGALPDDAPSPFAVLCLCIEGQDGRAIPAEQRYELRTCVCALSPGSTPDQLVECVANERLLFWLTAPDGVQVDEAFPRLVAQLSERFGAVVSCYIVAGQRPGDTARACALLEDRAQAEIPGRERAVYLGSDASAPANDKPVDLGRLYRFYSDNAPQQLLIWLQGHLAACQESGGLDQAVLRSLRDDFLQVSYSFLHDRGVAAHRVFNDPKDQALLSTPLRSAFDLMRLADAVVNRIAESVRRDTPQDALISKAQAYIHEHYSEELNREVLASHVGITPDYFSRLYNKELGMSLNDSLNSFRVERAKMILTTNNAPISDVALAVGFNDFSYFSKVFKRYVGVTPYQFRQDFARRRQET